MVDEDLELEEDLGEATLLYEGPDGDTVEKTVPNEHVAYFQDHWLVKTGEDEHGNDVVRRIPAFRVYYVERSIEEFEEEIKTLKDRVQSVADDLRTRIPVGGNGEHDREEQPIDVGPGGDEDQEY